MRAGVGFDSHRFSETRRLVLGGVVIPDHPGLQGHSDGDAVAHAVTDAVLGAAGLGDIGAMFPDTDAAYEGADSIALLAAAARRLRAEGFRVGNVDVTVIAESPRIVPHAVAMRERLAGALAVRPSRVSIKGKSNEGLGWIGRGEGLAAMAVATVLREDPGSDGAGGRA